MLKWKDEFSIGVDLIDTQHKHLFEIGNDANELLKNEFCVDKYDKIIQVLEDLRQYTKYHFNCEEEYMLKNNFSRYEIQKKQHDSFIKKIDSINLEQIDNDQEKYLKDLLVFVFNWVLDHILQEDKLITKK